MENFKQNKRKIEQRKSMKVENDKKLNISHWKYNTGITLITLVVTIILLIILAGITINIGLGDNALFNKAKYAKNKYLNSQINEEEQLNELYEQTNIGIGENVNIEQSINFEKLFENIEYVKSTKTLTSSGTTPSMENIRFRSRELYISSSWKISSIYIYNPNKWLRRNKTITYYECI